VRPISKGSERSGPQDAVMLSVLVVDLTHSLLNIAEFVADRLSGHQGEATKSRLLICRDWTGYRHRMAG
jgi:hypothetical protein